MKAVQTIEEITNKIASGNADVIFGTTREFEGKAIIPVSTIGYGLGGGMGKNKQKEKSKDEQHSEKGAGFGGGSSIKPLGYIVVTDNHAKFKPVYNLSQILTVFTVVFFTTGYALKTIISQIAKINARAEIHTG